MGVFSVEKLLWSLSSFASAALGITLSSTINYVTYIDICSLCYGMIILSTSFVYIVPKTEQLTYGNYPLNLLISLIMFTIMALVSFVRDSLTLMDDNILVPCDAVNFQTPFTFNSDSNKKKPSKKSKFKPAENIDLILLGIFLSINSILDGLFLSIQQKICLKDFLSLIPHTFEFVVYGKYLNCSKIEKKWYWLFGLLVAIIEPLCGAFNLTINPDLINLLLGISSSILFGLYIFLSINMINIGINSIQTNFVISAIVALLSGVLPIIPRIFF